MEANLRKKFAFAFEFRQSHIADFESNLFFILKDKEEKNPEELFEFYKKDLQILLPAFDLELKNGFLNLYFKKDYLRDELKNILEKKENYFKNSQFGSQNINPVKSAQSAVIKEQFNRVNPVKSPERRFASQKFNRVNLEFVSANPTGPLHLGNLRGGPIGETLANLFELSGAKVGREYYVNDLGKQSDNFVETIIFHLINDEQKFPFPRDGYFGDYAKELAQKIGGDEEVKEKIVLFLNEKIDLDKLVAELRPQIISENLNDIKITLQKIDINFDKFSFESELEAETKAVFEDLKSKGVVKEKEGAMWFYAKDNKELLGDRECVLIRSDGKPTYFLKDIAYHINKLKRGFDRLIDIWGANHFGHVPRLKAALAALGHKDKLEIVLYQQVNLKKKGQKLTMSKRKGDYISADQILDEIKEKDIFKVFMLQKTNNSHLDFDKDEFEKNKTKSPAYYLKYISARINGILQKIDEEDFNGAKMDFANLKDAELDLIKEIIVLPYKITKSLESLEPHIIYLQSLNFAQNFHRFYEQAPIATEKDKALAMARLQILKAAQLNLNVLGQILGIDLPKKM